MTSPSVDADVAVVEIRELKDQVDELKKMIGKMEGGANGSTS